MAIEEPDRVMPRYAVVSDDIPLQSDSQTYAFAYRSDYLGLPILGIGYVRHLES